MKWSDLFCELRKSKGVTPEEARKTLAHNYSGTMLVKMGVADALLGGATYSTADTVRPALQLHPRRNPAAILFHPFIFYPVLLQPVRKRLLAIAGYAINIKPNEDELAEIATSAADCAKIFGIDPKVAFLVFDLGSGKGEDVDKIRHAAEKAKLREPGLPIEGEIQFDAAVAPQVCKN